MKYFTLEFWSAYEDLSVFDQYKKYIQRVKNKLSPALRSFVETIHLHDAQIVNFNFNPAARKLEITLDTLFYSEISKDHQHRQIKVSYHDVMVFLSTSSPDNALAGSEGYGDLGYDEIELLEDKLFEHRMLFSSGIELQIRFAEIEWNFLDDAKT